MPPQSKSVDKPKPTSFLCLPSELRHAIHLESWNDDHLVELEQKKSFYDWILHRIQFERWAVLLREVSPHIVDDVYYVEKKWMQETDARWTGFMERFIAVRAGRERELDISGVREAWESWYLGCRPWENLWLLANIPRKTKTLIRWTRPDHLMDIPRSERRSCWGLAMEIARRIVRLLSSEE